MYRWKPIVTVGRKKRSIDTAAIDALTRRKCHVVLYYTPERGWYGSYTDKDEEPDDKPRLRMVMDATGQFRSVSTDVILRTADIVREGWPSET